MGKHMENLEMPEGKPNRGQSFENKTFKITRYSFKLYSQNLTPSLVSVKKVSAVVSFGMLGPRGNGSVRARLRVLST